MQCAQNKEKCHGARVDSLRTAKRVNTIPTDHVVHFIKLGRTSGRSVKDDEKFYVTDDGSMLTDNLQSIVDAPSSQPLYSVGNQARR